MFHRASVTTIGGNIGQGFYAMEHDQDGKAIGYFGEALMRLFGLSAQQIKWMRTKGPCFVAGTPVHTETGVKPIEERKGDILLFS